jgi:hypothetical protein
LIAILFSFEFIIELLTSFIFSVIGLSWSSAIKELMEHYAQREASYPVLKHIILENLRKIKNEKADEFNKVENILLHSSIFHPLSSRFYSMMKKSSKK